MDGIEVLDLRAMCIFSPKRLKEGVRHMLYITDLLGTFSKSTNPQHPIKIYKHHPSLP